MTAEIKELMTVRRKGSERVYLVCMVERERVRLVPYDADSVNDGARRSWKAKAGFWQAFELFEVD